MKKQLMANGCIKPKSNGFGSTFTKNSIILIAAMFSLSGFGALGSTEVQGFTQNVKVIIENAYIELDGAHVNLRDYDTNYVKIVDLTDSTRGSTVSFTSTIPNVSTGDTLQACLHTPADRMVCDDRVAYNTRINVLFHLDLAKAHS
jgi:hypothetical protein